MHNNALATYTQNIGLVLSLALSFTLSSLAYAATTPTIPGSADVGRIKPEQKLQNTDQIQNNKIEISQNTSGVDIPEGAKEIQFNLKDVKIEGSTVFAKDDLSDIYSPYIGKQITLDLIYIMADAITKKYRNDGYFLSLAYIPPQKINNGVITIKVVEGYISNVEIDNPLSKRFVILKYISQLKAKKPLKADEVEDFLLRLNDLQGYNFSGVLSSIEGENGAVKLTLTSSKKKNVGNLSFDNSGSRFLGPNQTSFFYSANLLPLQQTDISFLSSIADDELKYLTLNHSITLAPQLTMNIEGGYTKAKPGFTLKPFEVKSRSTFFSGSLNYQWIRQRQENLNLKLGIDSRNSTTDILDSLLTRDNIRAIRANVTYDLTDNWHGFNLVSVTLSKGIKSLGSSKKGDDNLSREEAKPDFTKAELSITRLQNIYKDWSLLMAGKFQRASGPLYSAEEFGYGGQTFGRAFDSSEISGDHGIAGSLELRYNGLDNFHLFNLVPYAFYDFGIVWNEDSTQEQRISGTSGGFGIRAFSDDDWSANIGLAWPLTRNADTPIYGQNENEPRIFFQVNKSF